MRGASLPLRALLCAPVSPTFCGQFCGQLARRTVVALLAIALLFPLGEARAARWEKHVITVYDFTGAAWQSSVQETGAGFNDSMPARVPRLRYRAMEPADCAVVPARRGAVVVCLTAGPLDCGGESWGCAVVWVEGGRIVRVKIMLLASVPEGERRRIACHELMHALTDSPDDDSLPHPDDSCVQGNLDHPGAWDVAFAKKVYGRVERNRKQRRE